jgi:hypothetical protein
MLSIRNSSTLYVDRLNGDDKKLSGLSPVNDGYGNGPYKTVEHALAIIKDLRKTGHFQPITVAFVNDYLLNAPILITPEVYGVTFRSYKERKRIIGGEPIFGWERGEFNGVPCLTALLPEKANGEKYSFTSLFVNGERAKVTRYPKSGTMTVIDTEEKRLVGCHMVGSYASEIIMTATMMVDTELTPSRLQKLVFPHPTVAEIIREAIFH